MIVIIITLIKNNLIHLHYSSTRLHMHQAQGAQAWLHAQVTTESNALSVSNLTEELSNHSVSLSADRKLLHDAKPQGEFISDSVLI